VRGLCGTCSSNCASRSLYDSARCCRTKRLHPVCALVSFVNVNDVFISLRVSISRAHLTHVAMYYISLQLYQASPQTLRGRISSWGHIHTHTHTHTHTHAHTHTHTHILTYSHAHTHTHARTHARTRYLHLLMRPLVLALQSDNDLVSQGLRTLELCVDNLSPLYLAPIIEPVKVDLMKALWSHMQTGGSGGSSVHTGVVAFRLLGKLGGRNRDTFIHPPVLAPISHKAPALRLALSYDETQIVYLAIDEAVKVAVTTLRTDNDPNHLRAAFQFLRGAVAGRDIPTPSPPPPHVPPRTLIYAQPRYCALTHAHAWSHTRTHA
jgi:hypothetical protein